MTSKRKSLRRSVTRERKLTTRVPSVFVDYEDLIIEWVRAEGTAWGGFIKSLGRDGRKMTTTNLSAYFKRMLLKIPEAQTALTEYHRDKRVSPSTTASAVMLKGRRRSLKEFLRDQKKADCPVCKLPKEVREELRSASRQKVPRNVQLEWLKTEFKITLTTSDLTAHSSGRHDD